MRRVWASTRPAYGARASGGHSPGPWCHPAPRAAKLGVPHVRQSARCQPRRDCAPDRACLHDLEVPSVAVYSDVDRLSRHVRYADEARHSGAAEAADSYLNAARIIEVAKASGADAIHPGYGFLAETPTSPPPVRTRASPSLVPRRRRSVCWGDKSAARALAQGSGCARGSGQRPVHDGGEAEAFADDVGYPLAVKAAAGGGGRGIRFVERPEDLAGSIARAQREAIAAFHDPRLYLEAQLRPCATSRSRSSPMRTERRSPGRARVLDPAPSPEDHRGWCPSPVVTPELRRALSRAAVRIARAANYESVGTVEFLLTEEGKYYFLEMNTRLQVGAPGHRDHDGRGSRQGPDPRSSGRGAPVRRGRAPHPRLGDRVPDSWQKTRLTTSCRRSVASSSSASPQVRACAWRARLHDGIEVTPHYDSLLAKVTAWGRHREGARSRMRRALEEFRVVGVGNEHPLPASDSRAPRLHRGPARHRIPRPASHRGARAARATARGSCDRGLARDGGRSPGRADRKRRCRCVGQRRLGVAPADGSAAERERWGDGRRVSDRDRRLGRQGGARAGGW